MAKNKARSAKHGTTSSIQEYLRFIESHLDAPLDRPDENELFKLDLEAGRACATQAVKPPEFGSGDRMPSMKLNYYRESIYEYPGALFRGSARTRWSIFVLPNSPRPARRLAVVVEGPSLFRIFKGENGAWKKTRGSISRYSTAYQSGRAKVT